MVSDREGRLEHDGWSVRIASGEPGTVRLTPVVGQRGITKAKSLVLGNDSFKGMGVAFSYEANQRLPRIFVSNITTSFGIQESNLW